MESTNWLFFAITLILAIFTEPSLAENAPDPSGAGASNADPAAAEPADFEEDEWHMDYVPTGFLPDSVYRELAWYGILQLQPLHHSTKHLEVAQLIWMHTLGRPHVILENPPQSAQSPQKINRQAVAEEGTKWNREQRSHEDLVMENIKNGVGGTSVRTVVSHTMITNYIIRDGVVYKCDDNSQPDMDHYRDKNSEDNDGVPSCLSSEGTVDATPLREDPCIEGENAPLEHSTNEGWVFCFGGLPRNPNYDEKGTIDCGDKIKYTLESFLELCAVDNNVVITYDYFATEPRKEVMNNSTLCSTWDPCHVSYLYRVEPPADVPPAAMPTAAAPCDTTVCVDCVVSPYNEGESQNMDAIIASGQNNNNGNRKKL